MVRECLVALAALLACAHARADETSDRSTAEALFQDGLRLLNAGQVAEACPKLAESERLDPSAGTQLNLADCYERLGRTASAWINFKDAIRASHARGRADWEALARKRAADLEPKLARVRIDLSAANDVAGLEITRDGAVVSRPALATPVPVDPGPHVVRATAPGRVAWESTIDARAEKTVDIAIPPLSTPTPVPAPAPAPAPEPTPAPVSVQKSAGFLVGGTGLAALLFGGVAAGLALSAKSDCTPYPDCGGTPGGRDANDRAHTWATVSTISFVAGAALLVAGVVLVLTAPKGSSAALVPKRLPATL